MKKHKNRIRQFCIPFLPLLLLMVGCNKNNYVNDTSFNENWSFYKGEVKNAETYEFDDSQWRKLDLPHDWAIEEPFDRKYNARTGGLPVYGTGWYRKHFTVKKEHLGKLVSIEFDGAMNNAHVWVNGQFAGERPYGYIGFEVDITPYLKYDEDNVIAVRLQPEDLAARWYTGAGIYRNVRLKINHKLHIPQYGTYITTPTVNNNQATICVQTSISNQNKQEKSAILITEIIDPSGDKINEAISNIVIQSGTTGIVTQNISVNKPELWDIYKPKLYKAISYIKLNNKIVDKYISDFGIREIDFSANKGFLLNGKPTKLNGVCMHHDMGPLGAAINYRAKERQMEIMKNMGVNALRTSHNPPLTGTTGNL
ncbi:sugar-binding domain-containing protein [Saccharicrinis fermentans]|uniref:Beta-galactosidase n=1 Tax=Saccharicrinis fermentans DSM 9555 = JCM 21142 TaxID=869213 RepID=W7Y3Y4_9BACT|nr:sugar-binding domain-containing protein [Saccharicrinis fermentans]GAF02762.1 beta-galactosidase [Saccharicrinis fermentans DSM 9555 = JCM 21142]